MQVQIPIPRPRPSSSQPETTINIVDTWLHKYKFSNKSQAIEPTTREMSFIKTSQSVTMTVNINTVTWSVPHWPLLAWFYVTNIRWPAEQLNQLAVYHFSIWHQFTLSTATHSNTHKPLYHQLIWISDSLEVSKKTSWSCTYSARSSRITELDASMLLSRWQHLHLAYEN